MITINPTAYTSAGFGTNTASLTGLVRNAGESIILLVWLDGSLTQTCTGAVWDSGGDNQSFTVVTDQLHNNGEARRLAVLYLANPISAKTATVSVSFSNTTNTHKTLQARLVSGVNTSGMIRGFTKGTQANVLTRIGIDITSETGDMVFLCSAIRDIATTIDPGNLSNVVETQGNGTSRTLLSGTMNGSPGTVSPGYSRNNTTLNQDNASIALSLIPTPSTDPNLTSGSFTATGSAIGDLQVTSDLASGTLYCVLTTSSTTPSSAQIAAGQDHTGTTAAFSDSNPTSLGVNTFNATGLTASTQYWPHFFQDAGVGDVLTGTSGTTTAANDPPTLTGSITVTNLGSRSYTLTWPAGSGDTTGYEVSLNAGSSWTDVGNVLTYDVTGRTHNTTDSVQVRAYDELNAKSTPPIAVSVDLLEEVLGSVIESETATGDNGSGFLFPLLDDVPSYAGKGFAYRLVSGGTEGDLTLYPNGSFIWTGLADGLHSFLLYVYVDGVYTFDLTVNVTVGGEEPPDVPQGTVTITNVVAGEDEATVTYNYSAADQTAFQYRINEGTVLSIGNSPANITGLSPGVEYSIQIRAINLQGVGAWSTAFVFETESEEVVVSSSSRLAISNTGEVVALVGVRGSKMLGITAQGTLRVIIGAANNRNIGLTSAGVLSSLQS